ncbi:MAG: biopolymer transporter ExbD [Gammaproteobacteria bacterium]|nr:biopolymer transporter ExbD [Gammaproteobacteria bacterium]MCP5198621.1 biopolymer transporter ExbD [Gammaproteobacteria bacterium]
MRRLAGRSSEEDEAAIDLTPMLDVVFIMLIFFIVTATFVKEAGIDVNRPDAATAVKQEKANILIAIDADNRVWIDRRQIDIRAVRPNIERLHAENPQGSVVIQADKASTTETLIKVMDASRSAGVYNVAIAAQEP